jgi:branched-chain amino acid aminotransferase
MFQVDWDITAGWGKPKITPNEPIKIDTTATSLHYGISAFEGLSIVKNRTDGAPQAFWANNNLKCFVDASDHLDMPTFDPPDLLHCLKKLVQIDQEWFPYLGPNSPSQLYLRLAHISTDEVLGVRTARKTKVYGIMNPTTLKPKTLRLKCASNVFKNWPLGHGSFRVASNFGPLVPTITDAKNNGFDDVLWTLDGFIKEMTYINVFAVIKSRFGQVELITPPNDGCIFNGSVRKSILELREEIEREVGVKVVEKQLSI